MLKTVDKLYEIIYKLKKIKLTIYFIINKNDTTK